MCVVDNPKPCLGRRGCEPPEIICICRQSLPSLIVSGRRVWIGAYLERAVSTKALSACWYSTIPVHITRLSLHPKVCALRYAA